MSQQNTKTAATKQAIDQENLLLVCSCIVHDGVGIDADIILQCRLIINDLCICSSFVQAHNCLYDFIILKLTKNVIDNC